MTEVSVGITISGGSQQRHLGFEVSEPNEKKIYHLASHCYFLVESPKDYNSKYMLVELKNFSQHEMTHISRYLNTIYKRNGSKIPYGFNFIPESVLMPDGSVPDNLPPGSGLTCATFVLQVLRNQDFNILDLESWEKRDSDEAWQESISSMLKPYIPVAHFHALKESIGIAVRFRPEEVAGCARDFEDEPIKFPEGICLGVNVYNEMIENGCITD